MPKPERPRLHPTSRLVLLLLVAALAPSYLPAIEELPIARVTVDGHGSSTRLLLTHSRGVTYNVAETRGRVEVLYNEPVRVTPSRSRVQDGILDGWKQVSRRRVVLDLGPGYRSHEVFELRNPDRLIIDLQGERIASAEPEAPEALPYAAPTVIVLDPGHGGSEFGAIGPTGLREKDVTLDLARRLKQLLQRDPGVSVVLTRDDDRQLDLDERTAIANHNRADLFLSIHLNSSPRRGAYGAETYFLSAEATDDEARTLAAIENRAYQPGGGSDSSQREGSSLDLILWDLAQNRYLAQSSALAESVQAHLNRLTGTRNRGVRQAPFRVLTGAMMPAILIEVGFISNPDEETRFRGLSYRNRVVEAIASAVDEFSQSLQRLTVPGQRSGLAPLGQ